MTEQDSRQARPKVWDPLVRVFHWSLVLSVLAAWLTRHGGGAWHEWLGYAALALIALRLVWGFTGSRYARFTQFMRSPANTLDYARRVLSGKEQRHLGHNPLGAWMIVALLLSIAVAGITGWLYTTDRFWGVEWMEDLHEAFAIAVLALAAVHVAGVVFSSWRHRENLVAAMLHGRKRAPGPEDVA
jgi:cytochrome b